MELQAATATPDGLTLDAASGPGDTTGQPRPEVKATQSRNEERR